MTVRYTFKKCERLCHTRDFLRVKHNGRYFFYKSLSVRILNNTTSMPTRLGIIVGKKFGIAVKRNRIKRLIREVFRLNKHALLSGCDMVIIPSPSASGCSYSGIEQDFLHICRKAGIMK